MISFFLVECKILKHIFENILFICLICTGIIYLLNIIFIIICLSIHVKYIMNFMNKINLDFQREKNDLKWNLVILIYKFFLILIPLMIYLLNNFYDSKEQPEEIISRISIEIRKLNNNIKTKESEIKNLNNNIRTKDNEISNLNNNIRNKESEIANLNNNIRTKNSEIRYLSNKINRKESEIRNLNNNIRTKNREIGNLKNVIINKNNSIDELTSRIRNKNNNSNILNVNNFENEIENKRKK